MKVVKTSDDSTVTSKIDLLGTTLESGEVETTGDRFDSVRRY